MNELSDKLRGFAVTWKCILRLVNLRCVKLFSPSSYIHAVVLPDGSEFSRRRVPEWCSLFSFFSTLAMYRLLYSVVGDVVKRMCSTESVGLWCNNVIFCTDFRRNDNRCYAIHELFPPCSLGTMHDWFRCLDHSRCLYTYRKFSQIPGALQLLVIPVTGQHGSRKQIWWKAGKHLIPGDHENRRQKNSVCVGLCAF